MDIFISWGKTGMYFKYTLDFRKLNSVLAVSHFVARSCIKYCYYYGTILT